MHEKRNRPAGNGAESTTTGCTHYIEGLRRRRAAAHRLPPLDCEQHSDPWPCHHEPEPVRGYSEAAEHLLANGLLPAPNLPAMRDMWRAGGNQQRTAVRIAEAWQVSA